MKVNYIIIEFRNDASERFRLYTDPPTLYSDVTWATKSVAAYAASARVMGHMAREFRLRYISTKLCPSDKGPKIDEDEFHEAFKAEKRKMPGQLQGFGGRVDSDRIT